MKCLNRAQMEEFILEVASTGADLSIHVQNCSRCRKLMAEVRQEQETWCQALYPEQLTDEFTRQVMASLADVPIEPAAEEYDPDTIMARKKGRSSLFRAGRRLRADHRRRAICVRPAFDRGLGEIHFCKK